MTYFHRLFLEIWAAVFEPVRGAVKEHVSPKELLSAVSTALTVGGLAGLPLYLAEHVGDWTVGLTPGDAMAIGAVLSFVIRLVQRWFQGRARTAAEVKANV